MPFDWEGRFIRKYHSSPALLCQSNFCCRVTQSLTPVDVRKDFFFYTSSTDMSKRHVKSPINSLINEKHDQALMLLISSVTRKCDVVSDRKSLTTQVRTRATRVVLRCARCNNDYCLKIRVQFKRVAF